MKCNATGIALIIKYEGCCLEAYRDPRSIWTIGYGHTGLEVVSGLTWTQEEANAQLLTDINMRAERPIAAFVTVPLSSNQFSSLCSLVFNIGGGNFRTSTLLQYLNEGSYARVPQLMAAWDHIDAKISPGLYNRRQAEIALWNAPDLPDLSAA